MFLLSESPIPNPQSRNANRSGAQHVATHLQGNETMATTTLNPSEISELIKTRIEKVKLGAEARNEGTVTSVSDGIRSDEHTSELPSLMRISYPAFWLTKKTH